MQGKPLETFTDDGESVVLGLLLRDRWSLVQILD